MRLGNYADGAWMFVATCGTCGRQTRVDPAEVLTHPRTHPHMRVAELALRPRSGVGARIQRGGRAVAGMLTIATAGGS